MEGRPSLVYDVCLYFYTRRARPRRATGSSLPEPPLTAHSLNFPLSLWLVPFGRDANWGGPPPCPPGWLADWSLFQASRAVGLYPACQPPSMPAPCSALRPSYWLCPVPCLELPSLASKLAAWAYYVGRNKAKPWPHTLFQDGVIDGPAFRKRSGSTICHQGAFIHRSAHVKF